MGDPGNLFFPVDSNDVMICEYVYVVVMWWVLEARVGVESAGVSSKGEKARAVVPRCKSSFESVQL